MPDEKLSQLDPITLPLQATDLLYVVRPGLPPGNNIAFSDLVAQIPGSGTVMSVAVATANGFGGTVANPTTTPSITISTSVTGILKGDGTGVVAAVAGDFPTLNQNTTGSAAKLTTARAINGVAFDGTGAITVTAAAGTLTGSVLNASVVDSSLTSVGNLVTGSIGTGFVVKGVTMTLGSDAANDLYYRNGSGVLTRLANGTTGQYLAATTGAAPSWGTPSGGGGGTWGSITGTLSAQTDLQSALDAKAPLTNAALVTPTISSTGGATPGSFVTGSDTLTNQVAYPLAIRHHHTGSTPAPGFGTGLAFQADTDTGSDRDIGNLNFNWTTETDGSRTAGFSIYLPFLATMTERFTITALGVVSAASFSGSTNGYVRTEILGLYGFGNTYRSDMKINDSLLTTDGRALIWKPPDANVTYTLPGASQTLASIAGTETFTNKTLTSPVINGATSTGSTSLDFSGNSGTFKTSTGATTLGSDVSCTGAYSDAKGELRSVPQNIQNATYTLVLSDAGKHIINTGSSLRAWTIPANSSVAYPIGTAITFVTSGTGSSTIAITTDVMYLAGGVSTGTRTLAAIGIATALKVASTTWVISGTNLT